MSDDNRKLATEVIGSVVNRCPNCRIVQPLIDDSITRRKLHAAEVQCRLHEEALTLLRRSIASAEQQDAEQRARLTRAVSIAEAETKEARQALRWAEAELAALRRALCSTGRLRQCGACQYVGELIGDHAEYCARCGENVVAQVATE